MRAMEYYVEIEHRVTEHWRSKGVRWEEQDDIARLLYSKPWWEELPANPAAIQRLFGT
jgi:hypothetical protein